MIRLTKWLAWRRPATNPADQHGALHSEDRMRAILDRERMRSGRGNSSFALVTLSFGKRLGTADLNTLGRIFRERLRATDDAGLLGPRMIGTVLPETPAEGAWKVAEDICQLVPADWQRPQCDVYVYPTDSQQPPAERPRHDRATDDRGVAQPMHVHFEQSLPAWKRAIDVTGAAMALIALAPVLLAVIAMTKWQSPGPALYRHERIGRHGRRFKVWKIRTMVANADRVLEEYLAACPKRREEWNRDHKLKDDPRITPLGHFLRKTSIDELPQLWNVLCGEMSLVGPRPIVTAEIKKYGQRFAPYCNVLPGMTGLWQVSGRNNTTYAQRVELDSYYARNWSLWLDLYILVQTVRVVLLRQGAY